MVVPAHNPAIKYTTDMISKGNLPNFKSLNAHIVNGRNDSNKENVKRTVSTTSIKPGKRRHRAICSPGTVRGDSLSPTAKYQTRERKSPSVESKAVLDAKTTTTNFVKPNEKDKIGVPKVAAQPPSPSQLPNPPSHWVSTKDLLCQTKKHLCREATQSLMTHLSTTGIFAAA